MCTVALGEELTAGTPSLRLTGPATVLKVSVCVPLLLSQSPLTLAHNLLTHSSPQVSVRPLTSMLTRWRTCCSTVALRR